MAYGTVTLNPGALGAEVAKDGIAGAEFQRVKVSLGAEGTAVDAVAGAGVVDTGTQRITLASDDPAVAALQILDNAISGSEMQVDIVAALPAGANTIGTVNLSAAQTLATVTTVDAVTAITNALPAGTNNIGDVDVASSALPTGAATSANQSTVIGHLDGVEGLLTTIDADTGNLGGILTSVQLIDNAISGSEMQVDIVGGGIAGATEDAVASGAAEGVLGIVVRDDALATLTPVDGDYTAQRVNARGATWVALDSTVAQTVTLAAGTATNEIVGDAAHDAAIAGNPVRIGARALSADYTAVATGDTADLIASLLGKLVTLPYALPASTWSYASPAAVADTSDDEAKAAGAAGVRHYITSLQVINADATVGTEVVIKDGSTVLFRGYAAAVGGGVSARFDPPLRGTAATAVNVANITTSAETYFNLQGYSAIE